MAAKPQDAIGQLIFSRRATQLRLSELDNALTPKQRADLVARLNRAHRDRLSAVWETVVMAAFHRVTPVVHEQLLSNGRKPDIALTFAGSERRIRVVADIATASDRGLHARNPFQLYWDALEHRVNKRGLNWGRFRFAVRGGHTDKGPIELWIPPARELVTFIKTHVDPFLAAIKLEPERRSVLEVRDVGIHVDLTYDPATIHPGATHTSFDQAHSLTRNPVYSALENKIDQLRGVDGGALRGIVLCDADCACMRSLMNPGTARSLDDIVNAFLRSTSAIDFVMTISVEKVEPWKPNSALKLRWWLYLPTPVKRRPILDDKAVETLFKLVDTAVTFLPKPVQEAVNAYLQCNRPGLTGGPHKTYRMDKHSIRMSSRHLVEILANGWEPLRVALKDPSAFDVRLAQRFSWMLEHGFVIQRVEVLPNDDHDDDLVEIYFVGPDPVIAPYR